MSTIPGGTAWGDAADGSLDRLEIVAGLGALREKCPYLPDEEATLQFLAGDLAGPFYRALLDRGYRRNGPYLYRPVCAACTACEVLRVPVASFEMSKEQRRVWRKGTATFRVAIETPSVSGEKCALYRAYLEWQHGTGKEEVDEEHYRSFFVESCHGVDTYELQLWAGERLAGIGTLDRVGDALSSVYFFFDPEFARYSPGTFSALWELELAQAWGLTYYYLGYYIADCRQMNYKLRYRPNERKTPDAPEWTETPT